VNRIFILRSGSWIAVMAWAAAIIWLSSLSGPELEDLTNVDVWDKGAHFIAFFCGAILVSLALRLTTAWSWPKIAWVAVILVSVFAATDEWHQLYTPKRSGADLFDWIADTLGAIAGAWATVFTHGKYQRTHNPAPTGA
jgi:VanZ family protein